MEYSSKKHLTFLGGHFIIKKTNIVNAMMGKLVVDVREESRRLVRAGELDK